MKYFFTNLINNYDVLFDILLIHLFVSLLSTFLNYILHNYIILVKK